VANLTGTVIVMQLGLRLPFSLKKCCVALTAVVFVGACSTSSANEYESFCDLSIRMDAASAGPHGQDPGAITDPERMRQVWANITDLARQMKEQSPTDITQDVATMVDSVIAMDAIFSDNNYDLTAMARVEDVRTAVDAISADPQVAQATKRYSAFMEKNCGPLSQ